MERKAKNAHEFVPAITECVVEKEETDEKGNAVVTRIVKFKEGMGPPGDVREVCVHSKPAKVSSSQGGACNRVASQRVSKHRGAGADGFTGRLSPGERQPDHEYHLSRAVWEAGGCVYDFCV